MAPHVSRSLARVQRAHSVLGADFVCALAPASKASWFGKSVAVAVKVTAKTLRPTRRRSRLEPRKNKSKAEFRREGNRACFVLGMCYKARRLCLDPWFLWKTARIVTNVRVLPRRRPQEGSEPLTRDISLAPWCAGEARHRSLWMSIATRNKRITILVRLVTRCIARSY